MVWDFYQTPWSARRLRDLGRGPGGRRDEGQTLRDPESDPSGPTSSRSGGAPGGPDGDRASECAWGTEDAEETDDADRKGPPMFSSSSSEWTGSSA